MVLVTVAVIAGAVLLVGGEGPPRDTTVFDCRNGTCTERTISRRPASCNQWGPWDPPSDLSCNWTDTGLERVTLVTDPGNYITAEHSAADPSIRVIETPGFDLWDLEVIGDDDLLASAKSGTVFRRQDGKFHPMGDLPVRNVGETGLMGIEPVMEDGTLAAIHAVFAAEVRQDGTVNHRLVRVEVKDGRLADRTVLAQGIPGGKYHAGGRLERGPGGDLYLTTGDGGNGPAAADPSRLNGKILRFEPDGTIPTGNPFDSPVYSRGHRNPQGLAWAPDGTLYATEHGPSRHDEINRIRPGGNYGWGFLRCHEPRPGIQGDPPANAVSPVVCYEEWTLAPSGAAFVNRSGHPWHGDLFVAGLRGNHLHRVEFQEGKVAASEIFYIPTQPDMSLRLRDVETYGGALYVAGDTRGIAVLTPDG